MTRTVAASATSRRAPAVATLMVLTAALFAYSTLETMLSPALPMIQQAVGASTPARGSSPACSWPARCPPR
jgi:predicted MFS family arabinose efflux permease